MIGNQIVHDTIWKSGKGEVSVYAVWIDKSKGLPYRFLRDLPHNKTIREVSNVKFDQFETSNFNASDYFPKGYEIREYKGPTKPKKNNSVGKSAPDWTLKNTNKEAIALRDLKSKVLVLQFTGIGCGTCVASIPFLKELVNEYKDDSFELVSIETWVDNNRLLKGYEEKNEFNFKFLNSTKEVTKSYNVQAVPVIFVLDKDRKIHKVVNGYSKGMEKEIRDAINELL